MKSAFHETITVGGRQFGSDLFDIAGDDLVRACTAKRLPLGDIMLHFALFRAKGSAIQIEALTLPEGMSEAEVAAWVSFAKQEYRRKVELLFVKVLTDWKRAAWRCKNLFNRAIKDVVPLAAFALVFPEDCPPAVALNPVQWLAVKRSFDMLADLAGVDRGEGSGDAIPDVLHPSNKPQLHLVS